MNVLLQWAIDPRGRAVPIHIAWLLIRVAFPNNVRTARRVPRPSMP